MKFKIAKEHILEGLQVVHGIVSARTTLPILSNVLVKASDGRLELTTTDLDVSISCSVEAEVAEEGATTLPARRLMSIVRELAADKIDVSIDDRNAARISCGSSRFKVVGLSDEDFPPLPPCEGTYTYSLEQDVFKEMLGKVAYAASTDETRYVLNGVLLSFKDGKLTMVATDGRRLALVEYEVEYPQEAEGELVIPSKTVHELQRSLNDEGMVQIQATQNQVAFDFAGTRIQSKLIEGTYPNFRQVIPAECEQRVPIERELLLTALKRVSLVTSDKSNSVRLTFKDNNVAISVVTPDVGEAHETLAVKYSGEEVSVAFSPEFLMDPLRHLSNDEVYMELIDELSPGVLKCDQPFLYVLMPMRVT